MTETEKPKLKYANISDRLFAVLLDLAMLYLIVVPISNLLFPLILGADNPLHHALNMIVAENPDIRHNDAALFEKLYNEHNPALLAGVKIFFYQAFLQLALIGIYFIPLTAKKGQTLGKFLVGLKVIDNITHKKISTMQSAIRFISYLASVLPIFLGIIWGGFRKDRRTWHDFFADTAVVYDENRWYKLLFDKIIGKKAPKK